MEVWFDINMKHPILFLLVDILEFKESSSRQKLHIRKFGCLCSIKNKKCGFSISLFKAGKTDKLIIRYL